MTRVDYLQLEIFLRGEFAGRIFESSKIIPVINVLEQKGEINQAIAEFLMLKSLVYFNSKNNVILSLEFNQEKEILSIDVVKSCAQNWIEVQDVCSKLYDLIPLEQIEITNILAAKLLDKSVAA